MFFVISKTYLENKPGGKKSPYKNSLKGQSTIFSGNSKKSNPYSNHMDRRQHKHYFQVLYDREKNSINEKYKPNISTAINSTGAHLCPLAA